MVFSHDLAAPLFSDWFNYTFYAFCAVLRIGCGYFIFYFIMYVNKDQAYIWLGSVGLSLLMTYIIFNPSIIVLFNGVLPLVITAFLDKKGILERLTDARTAVEYLAIECPQRWLAPQVWLKYHVPTTHHR